MPVQGSYRFSGGVGAPWELAVGLMIRGVVGATMAMLTRVAAAQLVADNDLSQLSLSQLSNLEVTSVSKTPESLNQAAASIYVITHERILRSGATNVGEALRLAPNLQVRQLSSTTYAVSARGFGGNQADQNFSNKMLILIDGRSVYTPLFSGVYLDAQDVLLEDVDRIEVISGPGATLWGANAMNGVINIITRSSQTTTGTMAKAVAGNQERDVNARYGEQVSDALSYRVYGMTYRRDSDEQENGSSAHDPWWKGQGGFRADWTHGNDLTTVQGDIYRSTEYQEGSANQNNAGANLLARWQHHTLNSDLQLQGYIDESQHFAADGTVGWVLHTYDFEIQQGLQIPGGNHLVWGAGERVYDYAIDGTTTLLFVPNHRDLTLGNIFGQDTWSLTSRLTLIAGVKLEDDPYSGWALQPDGRLSFALTESQQLWAAASRAIRAPTPFDVDVEEKIGTLVYLAGNASFRPERVNDYEVGYRTQPMTALAVSATAFYNLYDDLRSVEFGTGPTHLPLLWSNGMQGRTYGLETWGDWQVTSWWRLSPGYTFLRKDLRFKADSSGLLGIAQAGDDPKSQASLNSSMELPYRQTVDATLRYVGALSDPALAGYYELDARWAWRPTSSLELALVGQNLLHPQHLEYPAPQAEAVPRSLMAQVRWQR